MKPYQHLLSIVLALLLVSEGWAISLPSLSLFSSSKKADEDTSSKDDHHDSHHKPTRPPLIPAIPHPADHPLHPHNNPHHPLHPDNLPSLPSLPHLPHLPALPSLPHFTKETIHATKTVFVEVTDRVTIHPVCMTVHHETPPCLPYNPHHNYNVDHYHREEEVQDQSAHSAIEPTAVVELLEPTRILGGVSISESTSVEGDSLEPTDENDSGARSARYMELTPSISSSSEEVEIKDEPSESSGLSPINVVHNLIHGSPVTHYKTKTLWVTKVEKVLDTRVTATLLAKNCVPTNSHIPLCAPHAGVFRPGYHGNLGHHGEGIFSETHGGHFVKVQPYNTVDSVHEHNVEHHSAETSSTHQGKTTDAEVESQEA